MRLATTTSVENSGLLDDLLPPFQNRYNMRVDVIPVGTGKALALAESGDVDAVLVHAPAAENEFVKAGYGVNRRAVMYNYFVIVGPSEDPAKIRGLSAAPEALEKIARANVVFVSRGDHSGTHLKELELWEYAGISPSGRWYIETGQGMGATLEIANEKRGHALVDRGTYVAYKHKVELAILWEGDDALYNPYAIIAVNPHRHPHVRYVEAMMLIGWITSPEAHSIMRNFKKNGETLFYPSLKQKECF